MPMYGLLKNIYINIYIFKENKNKKNQNVLNMITSVSSRRFGSYRMYLEGDSLHQTVMIVNKLK